jgi:hypothetical protein
MLFVLAFMYLAADSLFITILLLEVITVVLMGLFASAGVMLGLSANFIWVFNLIVFGTIEFVLLVVLLLFINKFRKM